MEAGLGKDGAATDAVTVSADPRRLPAVLHLLFSILLSAASEIFLKLGAAQTADHVLFWQWLGLSGLASPWVWLGIVCLIVSFASWTQVLRTLPLNLAFALSNAQHILIPLGCWWFLGEAISPRRWGGILLVAAGLVLAAKPLSNQEERSA